MPRYLVVVESPAKAKTIKKYLGKDYDVVASYGHVRDLIPKEGAVDPERDFEMHYQNVPRSQANIDNIKKQLKNCDGLLLAPDPDREGEAIAWHILELLKRSRVLKNKTIGRVAFHEITKKAVQKAIQNPKEIDMDLVNAQQARRALDYLVGFTLSPLLWKKVRAGLSAGRVQTPALRMIVERELAIEKFVNQEYWTIHVKTQVDKAGFNARLIQYNGEKFEQFTITEETVAKKATDAITKAANGELTISKVNKKERKRQPTAPFITSTLQQEAARKLGFATKRTMQVAQQLYEGVDIGEGPTGLITYMRTDSVTLAQEALAEIRDCIQQRYGKENLPDAVRTYKTKTKNAQEAHEAIRPTSILRIPEAIKQHLTPEQNKLYDLIWKRTIASQMIDAKLDTVAVDLTAGNHVFRANGSTIKNPGFMTVYQETQDDKKPDDSDGKMLPPMEEGQTLPAEDIHGEQHFTDPPPRFTEASLVKALEEYGIGRPSTYANIISTLVSREYVILEKRRFEATDVARVVIRFLTNYFTQYVDYNFTATLEDELDAVSRGDKAWVPLLKAFWTPFKERIDHTAENVERSDVTQEKLDEECPKCSKLLSIRLGKMGRFIGCTAYPDCDYTRNLDGKETTEPEILKDRLCPGCQANLVIKVGRYGKFIGCSSYPKCKHIEPLEKPRNTEVQCPQCKKGSILERKSRRGKIFYSCERYPDCTYAIWNDPLSEPCPECQWPILTVKTTKRAGTEKACPQKSCKYTKPYPEGAPDNE
jgi:DNA topoisomerase I